MAVCVLVWRYVLVCAYVNCLFAALLCCGLVIVLFAGWFVCLVAVCVFYGGCLTCVYVVDVLFCLRLLWVGWFARLVCGLF